MVVNQDALRQRLATQLASHRQAAASGGIQIRLAKAGQKAKTVSVPVGTSIMDAFRQNGFKVKPDSASGKSYAVLIENVTPGQEHKYTDAPTSSRISADTFNSTFAEPVTAGAYYVIATNVEAGC